MGGDGLLHDHAGTSRTGVGYGSRNHDRTNDVTDGHNHLPDADSRRSLPACTGARSHPSDKEDEPPPPVARETVDLRRD
jgi:hypothetical protein